MNGSLYEVVNDNQLMKDDFLHIATSYFLFFFFFNLDPSVKAAFQLIPRTTNAGGSLCQSLVWSACCWGGENEIPSETVLGCKKLHIWTRVEQPRMKDMMKIEGSVCQHKLSSWIYCLCSCDRGLLLQRASWHITEPLGGSGEEIAS